MDKSTREPGSIVAVLEAGPPYRPWLRLAHLNDAPNGWPDDVARIRVLADLEIVLQLKESAWLHLPDLGGSVPVPEGSLCLIPPGLRHGQGRCRGDRHLAVHADLHAQPDLVAFDMLRYTGGTVQRQDQPLMPRLRLRTGEAGGDVLLPLVLRLDDPAAWRRRLAPLVAQWTLRTLTRPGERLAAASILAGVFADLLRLGDGAPAEEPTLARLLAEVDPCDRRLRVADLAHRAGLGETAFRTAVHALTGRSPRQWLEERRFEAARRLLMESDLPIAAVAAATGYDDPFHFSRVCRRLSGRSPRALRGG